MDPTNVQDVSSALALRLAALVLEPQQWIHRRVEQVSYLDQETIHRRITVDFDIPDLIRSLDAPIYLPIAQFAKRKLVNFDLRDADGTALAMLTAEQNGCLSTALLLALAKLYDEQPIDSIVERYIPILVQARSESEGELAWRRIFQKGTSVGDYLRGRPGFVDVADNLLRNFILYLPVDAEEAGARRIVKMSFDDPRSNADVSGLFARLGLRGVDDSFSVPLAGYCSSYHFELWAPPEMEVTSGRFFGTHNTKPVHDSIPSPTHRAHFNLSGLDRSDGLVVVALRVRSRELLAGTALFSVVNAVTLLFVLLRLHAFESDHGVDAVVGLLLVLPGILIGYIARPSEHEVLASFLTGLRGVALVSGLTAFLGALFLFAGFPEHTLHLLFAVLLFIALATSAILVSSWFARRR
jgi:hypothetical protein